MCSLTTEQSFDRLPTYPATAATHPFPQNLTCVPSTRDSRAPLCAAPVKSSHSFFSCTLTCHTSVGQRAERVDSQLSWQALLPCTGITLWCVEGCKVGAELIPSHSPESGVDPKAYALLPLLHALLGHHSPSCLGLCPCQRAYPFPHTPPVNTPHIPSHLCHSLSTRRPVLHHALSQLRGRPACRHGVALAIDGVLQLQVVRHLCRGIEVE